MTVDIELRGLGEFNLRNLCNGSIIAAIYVWNVRAVPPNAVNAAWNLLFGDRYAKADVKELAARIALRRPGAQLVQLECSYGGAMAAVCEEVSFLA